MYRPVEGPAPAAGRSLRLPDIPRCTISVPLPQLKSRYFPRLSTLSIVRPDSVCPRSSGTGHRRFGFRIVTPATRCPSTREAIPRRMTSTSGSSGKSEFRYERGKGCHKRPATDVMDQFLLRFHHMIPPLAAKINGITTRTTQAMKVKVRSSSARLLSRVVRG